MVIFLYVAPNSTIKFLSGVSINNTYNDTLYFQSETAQYGIFNSYARYTLTAQSYARVDGQTGILRVNLTPEQLFGCNYIMFQNTSFGSKWFYAFITKVEYRSNETSFVSFDLDEMQTWYFDYTVNECFIEREHSLTDNPGDNLVPENVETGEYMSTGYDKMIPAGLGINPNVMIVFGCTFGYVPSGGTPAARFPDYTGGANNGIFSGLALHAFSTVADAVDFVTQVVADKKLSGIICCYMMYGTFFDDQHPGVITPSLTAYQASLSVTKPTAFPGMTGYTVKCKKLLTAPYIQLYVTNNQGNASVFPFEYFSDDSLRFDLWGSCAPDPAVFAVPYNYKNVSGDNWDEKMILKGFPVCAFNVDSFKAWLAQSGSALAVSNMSSALSASISTASGNPGAALGFAAGVASTLQQAYIHDIQPPQSHGNVSGNVLYSAGLLNFSYCIKYIRPEFVRIIDDYFNKFGYATHRVKTPNIGTRPHWNYVQTKGCSIRGNVPADTARNICNIYDAGITFWKNGSEVGNYQLDNSPVNEP